MKRFVLRFLYTFMMQKEISSYANAKNCRELSKMKNTFCFWRSLLSSTQYALPYFIPLKTSIKNTPFQRRSKIPSLSRTLPDLLAESNKILAEICFLWPLGQNVTIWRPTVNPVDRRYGHVYLNSSHTRKCKPIKLQHVKTTNSPAQAVRVL